jgi:DNA-directed RNA polymerase specialized sigma24 family protein
MSTALTDDQDDANRTSWSAVRAVGDQSTGIRNAALSRLLTRYEPILNAHLVVKRGIKPEQASDLVQSFIQEKVLERRLIQSADPEKGKFRTFLLTSFDRFVIDRWRKTSREPRGVEPPELRAREPGPDVFDMAWAMQVLVEALRRMQAECTRKQRADLWGIFAGRILEVLRGASPVSYQILAERHGMTSAKQAANRYSIAEAMFRRNFAETLMDFGDGEAEIEAQQFRWVFSQAGSELVEKLRVQLWDCLPELSARRAGLDRGRLPLMAHLGTLPYTAGEPREMLRDSLSAPLSLDTTVLEPEIAEKVGAWIESQRVKPTTFANLFEHPRPLLDLLEFIKDYAKENRTDAESPMLREVSTVLYYVSISVALTRCGQRITSHDDAGLRQGFQWVIDQVWVDENLRQLLHEGIQSLNESHDSDSRSA